MVRIGTAMAMACIGCTMGCGATAAATTLSMNVATWPPGPPRGGTSSGEQILRATADRPVDVERYDPASQGWELLCTTPCEETVSRNGTYRVSVGNAQPSQPFGWTSSRDPWMVLRIDPDGKVWTHDSPSLRTRRAAYPRRAALASLAWISSEP